MEHKKILSFVLPVYNEEKNLQPVYESLLTILKPLFNVYDYEIIFIDDGSTDTSWMLIKQLIQKDNRVR